MVIAALTTYADWYIGIFKLKHPHVCKLESLLFVRVRTELIALPLQIRYPTAVKSCSERSAESCLASGTGCVRLAPRQSFDPTGRLIRDLPPAVMTLISGSAFLGLSTALNAISMHGTCTAVFVAVAAIATLPLASLRRLENIKWIGWIGLISMLVSILLVTIAVGAGGRPSLAPQEGPYDLGIVIWGKPKFADAMNAVANILLAYAGTAAL